MSGASEALHLSQLFTCHSCSACGLELGPLTYQQPQLQLRLLLGPGHTVVNGASVPGLLLMFLCASLLATGCGKRPLHQLSLS